MAGVVSLWNNWEVQALVLVSFLLQVFLLLFAGMRRQNISVVPRTLLWLAYLLADSIAIYILGHMSFCSKSHENQQLVAFWAPFLLVHLGGQDTITAYSMEDNQLWPRHLLSLVVQTVGVAYVLYKYIAGSWTLVVAAALIFVAGVLKYGERVWALKFSNLDSIRKFLDEVEKPRVSKEAEREGEKPYCPRAQWGEGERLGSEEVLQGAHDLFPICMGQFVDYKFWPSQLQSKAIELFAHNGCMYELIEMQLSLMHDILYTKAVVVFTWYGCFIRAISSVSTITAFFLFQSSIGKNDFNRVDAIVTYILIAGAVLLEMTALLEAMGSTWTCALLCARRWHQLHSIVVSVRRGVKAAERNRRWSGSIGQPELLNSSRCKGLWKKLHHSLPVISDGTKKLVLEEVCRMVGACKGNEDIMRSYSGQCALNPWHGFFEDPTSRAGIDFDEKILSWYFATKIFLSRPSRVKEKDYVVEAIRAVSNYMVFLLVERPYMLPSPVRPGLYANNETAYVSFDFSDVKHISRRGKLDSRRRMWDLDTRRDGDELDRVRGKLDIIREKQDILFEELVRRRKLLVRRSEELDEMRLKLDERMKRGISEDLVRERADLVRRTKDLDIPREELVRGREDLVRRREEVDKIKLEVDGSRENLEELNRIMKKLEELDRRSEELPLGPSLPPALACGAELAVGLLEVGAQGEQEVRRVVLGVWVEMLCYAAHHCSRDSHARQLNSGGEFITVVWLLSTAMFNRSYCDQPWFKKGVSEFFSSPFHFEDKCGWFRDSCRWFCGCCKLFCICVWNIGCCGWCCDAIISDRNRFRFRFFRIG